MQPAKVLIEAPLNEAWRYILPAKTANEISELRLAGSMDDKKWQLSQSLVARFTMAIFRAAQKGSYEITGYERSLNETSRRVIPIGILSQKNACLVTFENRLLVSEATYEGLEVRCRPRPATTVYIESELGDELPLAEPEFLHSRDYLIVFIRGCFFSLGPTAAQVIRLLHRAEMEGEPWCYEKEIMDKVGAKGRLFDLFKRHEHIDELIAKMGKGRCRLNLSASYYLSYKKERRAWQKAASEKRPQ